METPLLDEIRKKAGVAIPEGGLKPGLLINDITQVMTPEDAVLVKEKLPWYKRTGPGLLPSSAIGAMGGSALITLAKAIKNRGMFGVPQVSVPGLAVGAVAMPSILYALSRLGRYDRRTLDTARKLVDKARGTA